MIDKEINDTLEISKDVKDCPGSAFKDARGRWRTQSLFLEQSYSSTSAEPPMFTMRPDDHHSGLPSFRRLYLECADPTEYKQATTLLGGWDHWQTLLKARWFNDYISVLREELTIKLRSDAILAGLEMMKNPDTRTYQYVKLFAESEFKDKRRAGRPTKAETAAAAKEEAEVKARVQRDAARLGLSVAVDNS